MKKEGVVIFNKNFPIFIIGFVFLVLLLEGVFATNINSCQTLASSDIYTLTQDVGATGTCMGINVSGVELDCQGFKIFYGNTGSGYGVNITNSTGNSVLSNVTITNCLIIKNSTSGASNYGVSFVATENSTLFNNTINTTGTNNNYGVYLSSSSSKIVVDSNRINTGGNTDNNKGIYFDSSSNNNISNNIISTGGQADNEGLYLSSDSDNNLIQSNNISSNGSSIDNYGINLNTGPNNNTIKLNKIMTNGGAANSRGVNVFSSSNNYIINNTIITNGTTLNYGIYLFWNSQNNTFSGNNITIDGTAPTFALNLDEFASGFPNNNIFESNLLSGLISYDINFVDAGIDGTWLINQRIRNYSFKGFGGTLNVKNTSYGEIIFLDDVNGSGANLIGNSTSDIIFGDNLASVDSSSNQEFNKSANVTLYGIGDKNFNIPVIMRNGEVCDNSTTVKCYNFTSLSATNVKFNVSSWTNYSIGGNISSSSTTTSSSGSGTGGTIVDYLIETNNNLNLLEFKTRIFPGHLIQRKVIDDKGLGISEIEIKAKELVKGSIYISILGNDNANCIVEKNGSFVDYREYEITSDFHFSNIESTRVRLTIDKDWIFDNGIKKLIVKDCSNILLENQIVDVNDDIEEYDVYMGGISNFIVFGVTNSEQVLRSPSYEITGNIDKKEFFNLTNIVLVITSYLLLTLLFYLIFLIVGKKKKKNKK